MVIWSDIFCIFVFIYWICFFLEQLFSRYKHTHTPVHIRTFCVCECVTLVLASPLPSFASSSSFLSDFSRRLLPVCMCGWWYDDCLCMLFCPLISLFDDFSFTIIHQSIWLCMYYTCIFFSDSDVSRIGWNENSGHYFRLMMATTTKIDLEFRCCPWSMKKRSLKCVNRKNEKKKLLLSSLTTTTNKTRYKKKTNQQIKTIHSCSCFFFIHINQLDWSFLFHVHSHHWFIWWWFE